MAIHLNDRQRIELSLPVHMMLTVLIAGASDLHAGGAVEARQLLLEAAAEPLGDMHAAQRLKLVRRVKRLHRDILAPYSRENAKAAQVGLVTFYMLQAITRAGFLIVGKDSCFARALTLMLPAIDREMDADIDGVARRQAKECLARLQSLGYYNDPAVIECFDVEPLSQ